MRLLLVAGCLYLILIVTNAHGGEVMRVIGPTGHQIMLTDEQAPAGCPAGTSVAVYMAPHANPIMGCWYEWRDIVRIAFEDNDSLAIPRSQFKRTGL